MNCGGEGHYSEQCPERTREITCPICNQRGHHRRACTYSCPKCGEHGHNVQQCRLQKTHDNTLLSRTHGRQRRAERAINKCDLQTAVKHGHKTAAYPNVKTGAARWRYTVEIEGHPGWWLVFITDVTSKIEITSYWTAKHDATIRLSAKQLPPRDIEKTAGLKGRKSKDDAIEQLPQLDPKTQQRLRAAVAVFRSVRETPHIEAPWATDH